MSNKRTSGENIKNAIESEIIRSKRKTLSLEVKRDGKVIVRAPLRISMKEISYLSRRKRTNLRVHKTSTVSRKEIPSTASHRNLE